MKRRSARALGKNKIPDMTSRMVTFCKRKRGIIKKAIELSQLCDVHIHMAIFDVNKQRLVEFGSHDEFTADVVCKLTDPSLESNIVHEKYSNLDYEFLSKESLSTTAFEKMK